MEDVVSSDDSVVFRYTFSFTATSAQESEGGSLIVTASIHHPTQLLPVVRYWMPHVRIIEPRAWEQSLIDELRQTLAAWEGGAGMPRTF